MKKGEVRDLIYSRLTPLLAASGFRLKKGIDGGYFRPIPDGRQWIGVPLVDYNPDFKFSLVLGVRLNAIEDIANKFNAAPAKNHAGTFTFTTRIERFMPGEKAEFLVSTAEEIKIAMDRLQTIIEGQIVPFLDKSQNLPTVAEAMDLTNVPLLLPGGPNLRALLVARLVGHPDFETIAATYQQRLSQYPQSDQESLRNFIQYLRESH